MASLRERARTDGSVPFTVLFRERASGKQTSLTFTDRVEAQRMRLVIEAKAEVRMSIATHDTAPAIAPVPDTGRSGRPGEQREYEGHSSGVKAPWVDRVGVVALRYMYRRRVAMALSIRLTPEEEQRLEALAVRTGRSKTFYVREAIHQHLEELEERFWADDVVTAWESSDKKTRPADELWAELGV